MITSQMVEDVMAKLSEDSFAKGRWNNPYAEIQDDFQYLFVSVAVADTPVDMTAKNDIASLLVSTVPPSSDRTIGNWMVVFKRGKEVVDSWAPYDL